MYILIYMRTVLKKKKKKYFYCTVTRHFYEGIYGQYLEL